MEIKTEFSIAEQLTCIEDEIQVREQMLPIFNEEPGRSVAINDLNCMKAVRATLATERMLEVAAEMETEEEE